MGGLNQKHKSGVLRADQQNKKDIEKALQKATKAAEQAIRAAAKSHAQAGLEFEPPAGFQIDLSVYQKVIFPPFHASLASSPSLACSSCLPLPHTS